MNKTVEEKWHKKLQDCWAKCNEKQVGYVVEYVYVTFAIFVFNTVIVKAFAFNILI
jgi:hypothetical protein